MNNLYEIIPWLIAVPLIAAIIFLQWKYWKSTYVCPNCGNRFTRRDHLVWGFAGWGIGRKSVNRINIFTAPWFVYAKCHGCKTYGKCCVAREERKR